MFEVNVSYSFYLWRVLSAKDDEFTHDIFTPWLIKTLKCFALRNLNNLLFCSIELQIEDDEIFPFTFFLATSKFASLLACFLHKISPFLLNKRIIFLLSSFTKDTYWFLPLMWRTKDWKIVNCYWVKEGIARSACLVEKRSPKRYDNESSKMELKRKQFWSSKDWKTFFIETLKQEREGRREGKTETL